MEKDCGAWINLLSHRVKARMDAKFQDLGITGVQSRVIFYIFKALRGRPCVPAGSGKRVSAEPVHRHRHLQLFGAQRDHPSESVESDARLKSLVPTQRASELDEQVRACLRETDRMLSPGDFRRPIAVV